MTNRSLFLPLRMSLIWMTGTFILFLGVGEVQAINNLGQLTAYVAFTIACSWVGYRFSAVRYRGVQIGPEETTPAKVRIIKTLIALGALYYLFYGVVYSSQYGVFGLTALKSSVADPGSAYRAKFNTVDALEASGVTSAPAQAITLLAVLSTPLVPFIILYWKRVTFDIKLLAFVGISSYAAFFLSIGTLVGLGSLLIFAIAGLVVRKTSADSQPTPESKRKSRRMVVAAIILALGFASYMAYNQGSRISDTSVAKEFEPNPIVQKVASEEFARGVTLLSFYPTHGYQGLAYNLETPFQWTGGRGASRALDSYATQYGIAEGVADRTYPARTEKRMGWPAGMYWATIYPWLASDLGFLGAALFMAVVGWWMARWWVEAVAYRSKIAMLLFAQTLALVAYVPANNQVGLSRPNLIAFATLVVIYIFTPRRGVPQFPHLKAAGDDAKGDRPQPAKCAAAGG